MAGENTVRVRAAERRVFEGFSLKVLPLGFAMTKNRFWTRVHEHWVDVVHLQRHGAGGGSPSLSMLYRVESSIRVLADPSEHLSIRGLSSESVPTKGYRFGCHAKNEATFERCIAELARYVVDVADPWFARHRTTGVLLAAESPLSAEARAALADTLKGRIRESAIDRSRRHLGLKE